MNKRGATSVLIIMLMVVLMVFGLTILTTALSNKTLSEKKQTWLMDYYLLEGKAAEKLAEIDLLLQRLKEDAVTNESNDRLTTYQSSIENLMEDGYISFTVFEEGQDYNKSIRVDLQVILNKNDISDLEFIESSNYEIIRYIQEQELFDYEDIEYGNPFFPKED